MAKNYSEPSQLYHRQPAQEYHADRFAVVDSQRSSSNLSSSNEGVDIGAFVGVFWKSKWLILSVLILGVLLSFILTSRIQPLYKAGATVEIHKSEVQIVEGAVGPANIADAAYMQTQYALLKSRSLAQRVVDNLNLASSELYADQLQSMTTRRRQATDKVMTNIVVSPVGNSRLFKVNYISSKPDQAALVANELVDAFIETNLERKYNTTAYARTFLSERLSVTKEALEKSERNLVNYAEEMDILDIHSGDGQQASLGMNNILALNNDLSVAESQTFQAEQAVAEMISSDASRSTIDSPILQKLRAKLFELEGEYEELLKTLKPAHPTMIKLDARIQATNKEIDSESEAILNLAKSSLLAAQETERSLRQRIAELKNSLQGDRNRRIEYNFLKREVDTARSQYDALLQRLKEVTVAGGGVGSSQESIVDRAIPPSHPFAPNLQINLLQAALVSLILGFAIAYALHYADDTIKTPDDITKKLGLSVLGVIPKVSGKKDLILTELENPKSSLSEAYFTAKTSLEFSAGGGVPKTIHLTSTKPEEGKTSTTTALASSFAKSGKSVLIIDADMRKPSFVASAELSIGLSGLLASNGVLVDCDNSSDSIESLSDNVIESTIPGLDLLPSGVIPPNPAELLSSSRLAKILEKAEDLYDLVIIDSPPILNFADGTILGSAASGTVLVIKSGGVRRQAVGRTIDRLRKNQATILGVVLTQFNIKKSDYASDYYYAYGDEGQSYINKQKPSANIARKITLFSEKS